MNRIDVDVPRNRWDFFLELLDIKFRVRDPGVDTFPKLYRQGARIVLRASGYYTPLRYLLWQRFSNRVTRFTRLGFFGSVLVWLFEPWRIQWGTEALAVGILSLLLWIALGTALHKPIGRLLLGKRTDIEFTATKIKIYRNGYGLSWPITLRRHPDLDVSADLDENERGKSESIALRNHRDLDPLAAMVFSSSYHVKIIHGSRVERVAEVYGEFMARRFSGAIKKAEELRLQIVAERLEERARIEELPE